MKITHNIYSIVIRGNSHNPTVISDMFLLKTGIISDESEIDRNKLIVTPALFQANLKGNTNLMVETNSLNISSQDFNSPYDIAKKYCDNLKFIKSTAIGINFDITVAEYDFDSYFNKYNNISYNNSTVVSVVHNFDADSNTIANVTIHKQSESKSLFRFNFHRNTPSILLGDLNVDFNSIASNFLTQAEEFISTILK